MRSLEVRTAIYSRKYGGFPDAAACALAFHHAVRARCEEIVVLCEGHRPRHYTIDEVREWLYRHPLHANLAASSVPELTILPGVYRRTPEGMIVPS